MDKFAGGGGGGGRTHVVISTVVVNEASFAVENIYDVDVPVTVIVVLWLASRSMTPLPARAPFASTIT
jgi:MinD superfamily P-loop ATPase